jgi:Zn-dependent protease with chaperone function
MLNITIHLLMTFAAICVPFYYHHRAKKIVRTPDAHTLEHLNRLNGTLIGTIVCGLIVMSAVSLEKSDQYISKISFFSSLFSVVVLNTIHRQVRDRLSGNAATSQQVLRRSSRMFSITSILFLAYLGLVNLLIPHVGTLPAIAFTVIALNYLSPWMAKTAMEATPMHPSALRDGIAGVFRSAGCEPHEVYIVDQQNIQGANAFVCGPKYGVGPFRRSVFVTKSLFETLEPEEIYAVFRHEAAHFKLNHLFQRGWMGLVSSVSTMAVIAFPLIFILLLLKPVASLVTAGVVVITLMTMVVNFRFIYQIIRKQEYEADLEAIAMGTPPQVMISTLEKITRKNGQPRSRQGFFSRIFSGDTHPSLDERIEAILHRRIPIEARILPSWQVSLSYASFLILSTSLALIYSENSAKTAANGRSVASVQTAPRVNPSGGATTETRQKLPTPPIPVKSDTGRTDE